MMMQPIILIIVFCLGSPLVASQDDDDTDEPWEAYVDKYNKTYDTPEEEEDAKDNFKQHMVKVAMDSFVGKKSHQTEINEFSDTPLDEVIEQLCQTIPPDDVEERIFQDFSVSERQAPSSFSWVDQGMVSQVRDQGGCGSCWAFSAAQAIECQANMKWDFRSHNGWQWYTSPQQLVDCSSSFGNGGCNGGWPQSAFRYVVSTSQNSSDTDKGGIIEEMNYPYTAQDGTCNIKQNCNHFKLTGYQEIGPSGDEQAVMQALYKNGPLTCAIYVSQEFMDYSSGVFIDKTYTNQGVNHGVLLTGYGTQDGQDYWEVKNSWGQDWGNNGYIWIARNYNNHLKVASYTSCPTGIYV